jgi:septation ring formation regulator EzrA
MLKNDIDPVKNDYFSQETMSKQELEQYFTAVKEDFNHIDERFDAVDRRFDAVELRLNRIESILFMILEIVKGNDVKWSELDRRVFKLEQRAV